jgi:uncharacterized protein with GYD domain
MIILSFVAIAIVATTYHSTSVHAFVLMSPHSPKYSSSSMRRLTPPITSPAVSASYPNNRRNILQVTATASSEDLEKEISAMRAKAIREELESYGISTKSFFEKSELVDALVKARIEGKTPITDGGGGVNGDTSVSPSSSSSSSSSSTSTGNRQERIKEEMEKCKKMKVGDLKKELESYGMSTKSYFEKTEFVRAVAEARVDGPKESTASGSSGTGSASSSGGVREEPMDPSFRDVTVTKFNKQNLLGGKAIDVRSR